MPRLDNTSPTIMLRFGIDPALLDDPGQIPPIDVCQDCLEDLALEIEDIGQYECDHPGYDELACAPYYCRECKKRLASADDDFPMSLW